MFCVADGAPRSVLCIPPIAGATGLTQVPRSSTGGLLGCYYVTVIFSAIREWLQRVPLPLANSCYPESLLYSWANLNAAGSTKRVVTTATMFVFQCAGNVSPRAPPSHSLLTHSPPQIIGPQVYLAREKPYYHTGLYVDIACWSMLCLLILAMSIHLRLLNRRQEARRVALGLPAGLQDISIMSAKEAEEYRVVLAQKMRESGVDESRLSDQAFDDLTDFQNPSFIYVL